MNARQNLTERRSSTPFAIVYCTYIALLILVPVLVPGTPRVRSAFFDDALPVAVPAWVIFAWIIHRYLVGKAFKPKSGPERIHTVGETWVTGFFCSTLATGLTTFALAIVVNRFIGLPYSDLYRIDWAAITHSKYTCYGLDLTNIGDTSDSIHLCVPEDFYATVSRGEIIRLTGQRSRYANQVFTYVKP